MKKLLILILVILLCAGVSFAAGKGSAKEAKALVAKAVEFWKANGKEKAFAEINNPKGKFVDRDLYVMVMDLNGKMLAHGATAALIGKNLYDLRDPEGKYMVREFINVAKTSGSGWVDYKWTNPVTKKVENKSSYVQKHENLMLICGIYK